MYDPIELQIDVPESVDFGVEAHTAATVFLPDDGALCDPPVVCFAFPGGGYCRRYFSFDMPNSSGGGEAAWHVDRGWIFVACDHLGFGDSTIPKGNALNFENVALGNQTTVDVVMAKLEAGTLLDGFAPVRGATRLGIGQSMGGCFTIVLQAHHQTFDGIASLGYSGIHTVVPTRPGAPQAAWPWIARGDDLDHPTNMNRAALVQAAEPLPSDLNSVIDSAEAGEHPFAWAFHYDDVPRDIVAADLRTGDVTDSATLPPWSSASVPPCAMYMVAPGAVALEAATITVPVLVAVGERDVVPDPWMEPKAFKSATDISLFVCPRMGHMHNFAGTRREFWHRIHTWGTGVTELHSMREGEAHRG